MNNSNVQTKCNSLLLTDWEWLNGKILLTVIAFAALITSIAFSDTRGVNPMIESEFDQHMLRLGLTESQIVDAKQIFLTYQLERKNVDRALKSVYNWKFGNQPYTYHARNKDLSIESNALADSAYSQWDAIIRDLEDRYFISLKALAPEKEEVLASMRRARLRRSMLDKKHIKRWAPFGTNLDLIAELQGTEFENESINQILLEYEYSMQRELEKLGKAFIESEKDGTPANDMMKKAVKQFGVEGAKAEINALVMDGAQVGLALSRIRSLNERTIEKLLTLLPGKDAERLRNKVYPELCPFLYKKSQPISLYSRVQKLVDLTEEQRVAIQRLRDDYLIRRDRKLVTLAAVYRQSVGEDSILARNRSRIMVRATRDRSLSHVPAETLAFESTLEEWRSIEALYITRINSILTTKQKTRVK